MSRHRGRPFTPLRQVLAEAGCGVPRKYRVLCRVLDYTPKEARLMCHTTEECGLGGPSGGLLREGACAVQGWHCALAGRALLTASGGSVGSCSAPSRPTSP